MTPKEQSDSAAARLIDWGGLSRSIVFALAATSIWCLMAEMYHLCSMRLFTFAIFVPALGILAVVCGVDLARGPRVLVRNVMLGAVGGIIAAISYDIFRLPFVFAREWHIAGIVPPLNLFKVFPRFGAMILGQPIEQVTYSLGTQITGWAYHFSNGLTFGIMYLAMVGDARRRSWTWAVVMAVGLELAMIVTPYPGIFGITVGTTFVVVTLAAHLIFGVVLGLFVRARAKQAIAA